MVVTVHTLVLFAICTVRMVGPAVWCMCYCLSVSNALICMIASDIIPLKATGRIKGVSVVSFSVKNFLLFPRKIYARTQRLRSNCSGRIADANTVVTYISLPWKSIPPWQQPPPPLLICFLPLKNCPSWKICLPWNLCLWQQLAPPVSHMFLHCEKLSPKIVVLLLCVLCWHAIYLQ